MESPTTISDVFAACDDYDLSLAESLVRSLQEGPEKVLAGRHVRRLQFRRASRASASFWNGLVYGRARASAREEAGRRGYAVFVNRAMAGAREYFHQQRVARIRADVAARWRQGDVRPGDVGRQYKGSGWLADDELADVETRVTIVEIDGDAAVVSVEKEFNTDSIEFYRREVFRQQITLADLLGNFAADYQVVPPAL